jgi:hypothetical protein
MGNSARAVAGRNGERIAMSNWTLTQAMAHNRRIAHGRGDILPPDDATPDGEEEKLHKSIIDYCMLKAWICLRSRPDLPTGRMPGEPDFSIWADGGRRFDIECKTRRSKPRPTQLGFIFFAERLGHKVHIVRSFSEFLAIVEPVER